jgi:hypothetical protein
MEHLMSNRVFARLSFFAALLSVLSGCASGATAKGMTMQLSDLPPATNSVLAKSVALGDIKGGKDTNPAWTSQVSDADFKMALADSLRGAGLLRDGQGAPYTLTATLQDLDQPIFGFNMTVKSAVRYVLTESATGKVILDEQVRAEHTATAGDAFYGPDRLRLANEGSARKNITALVAKLNALKLPAGALSM